MCSLQHSYKKKLRTLHILGQKKKKDKNAVGCLQCIFEYCLHGWRYFKAHVKTEKCWKIKEHHRAENYFFSLDTKIGYKIEHHIISSFFNLLICNAWNKRSDRWPVVSFVCTLWQHPRMVLRIGFQLLRRSLFSDMCEPWRCVKSSKIVTRKRSLFSWRKWRNDFIRTKT